MSFEAKGKLHRKSELERAPRGKHSLFLASSRRTKFGIVGSLNTTAPVKFAERQAKTRNVAKTFARPASDESLGSFGRDVASPRHPNWEEQVMSEMQSSSSCLGGSPVTSDASIVQLRSGWDESQSLDAGLLSEQSQQSTLPWPHDGGGSVQESGLVFRNRDMLRECEQNEIDEQLLLPQDNDGGSLSEDGHSYVFLRSLASGDSVDATPTVKAPSAQTMGSQYSLQTTLSENSRASSLLLVSQEHDGHRHPLLQDEEDSLNGLSFPMLTETTMASGTEPKLQGQQTAVKAEEDEGEERKKKDGVTAGHTSPAVKQPSDENTASDRSELVVRNTCDHYLCVSCVSH